MKTIKGMNTTVIISSTLFYLGLCGGLMSLDYWYATSRSPLASANITQHADTSSYRVPMADKIFDLARFSVNQTLTPIKFRQAVATVIEKVNTQDISYEMFCNDVHCEVRIAADDATTRAELIALVVSRVKALQRTDRH